MTASAADGLKPAHVLARFRAQKTGGALSRAEDRGRALMFMAERVADVLHSSHVHPHTAFSLYLQVDKQSEFLASDSHER
jgi:hypothetical protein